jgi:hypothetical protein
MKEFRGTTLSSLIKSYDASKFDDVTWKRLLTFCGAISIIDCFMGNDDRFIRINSSISPQEVTEKNSINPGNLMISKDKKIFFPIDNSTSCVTVKYDETVDLLAGCFFEEEEQQKRNSEKSLPSHRSLEKIKEEEEKKQKLIEAFHKIFFLFSKNPEILAEAIINGFEKEFVRKANEVATLPPPNSVIPA